MSNKLVFPCHASSYGTGPFHPAIRDATGRLFHWPDITKEREEDAYNFARDCLQDAAAAAQMIADQWKISPVKWDASLMPIIEKGKP